HARERAGRGVVDAAVAAVTRPLVAIGIGARAVVRRHAADAVAIAVAYERAAAARAGVDVGVRRRAVRAHVVGARVVVVGHVGVVGDLLEAADAIPLLP